MASPWSIKAPAMAALDDNNDFLVGVDVTEPIDSNKNKRITITLLAAQLHYGRDLKVTQQLTGGGSYAELVGIAGPSMTGGLHLNDSAGRHVWHFRKDSVYHISLASTPSTSTSLLRLKNSEFKVAINTTSVSPATGALVVGTTTGQQVGIGAGYVRADVGVRAGTGQFALMENNRVGILVSADSYVLIDRPNRNGAGSYGGLRFRQNSIGQRSLYMTGNDGSFSMAVGGYSNAAGEFQIAQNQVGVSGQFNVGPNDKRVVRGTTGAQNTLFRIADTAAAYANAGDVRGQDAYIIGQSGGAHTAANPRGGDIIVVPGAAGAGGTGRDGRMALRGSFVQDSDDFRYFGDPDTDGTWRSGRSGNDLVFQRRESSAWVTKQTILA